MSECSGACCSTFTLSLKAQADLAKHRDRELDVKDADVISAMVIRLGWLRAVVRNWRLGYGFKPRKYWSMRGVMFTCRFWNPKTRLCRRYVNRPGMCRRYAVDLPPTCQHGCGMGKCEDPPGEGGPSRGGESLGS